MKLHPRLSLYSFLANFRVLKKSYTAKIMLVAFLGTHIPLLALLLSFVISNNYDAGMVLRVMIIALLATLMGTAATLYVLNRLLAPVILTSVALKAYLNTKALPNLPTQFIDEAGTLMADTSQTLHQLDEMLHYATHYDDLTGLPNRELFCDRLCQTLSQSRSSHQLMVILVLGLDDFTEISHSLGHETANLLVRAVAQRLSSCIAQTDRLARSGEGEFAIARAELTSLESVIGLAQLTLKILAKPFVINGNKIHITASIGIAIDAFSGANVVQVLKQAYIALSLAKQQGRNHYQFYSPEMNAQLQERLALENDLYGALERGEFLLHYQPLIDLRTNQMSAVEALIRWQHPTRGLVSPAKFIPIAEANGLIVPIGEWVLRTACAQNRIWQDAGFPPIRMSVNLSARQFEQPNLVEIIRQILKESNLAAAHLELEVTESFLMSNVEQSIQTLRELRSLDISLALDDFGTGYSSLNYLKRFPVNMLKIDQSFVRDVVSNPDSAAVTNAIIALAKSLQLNITAEGVETKEQLDYLQARGCEEVQGYYFGRPAPADAIAERLKQSKLENCLIRV
jgi:diguanylate cyclase (GGDEF)-like protein